MSIPDAAWQDARKRIAIYEAEVDTKVGFAYTMFKLGLICWDTYWSAVTGER